MSDERPYVFGPFRLDAPARELTFRGDPVELAPKALTALAALVERAGRVVSKDELAGSLGDPEGASDASIAQTLYRVRQTLARYDGARYVATVPGQGYQFVHAVKRGNAPPPAPQAIGEGFDAFQRAKYLLGARTGAEDIERAIVLLHEATRQDPSAAAAFAALGEAHLSLAFYFWRDPAQQFPQAEHAAEKALLLEGRNAEATCILAESALFFRYDWKRASDLLDVALELDPSSVRVRFTSTFYKLFVQNYEDAKERARALLSLQPGSVHLHAMMGIVHFYCNEPEPALPYLRDVLQLAPQNQFFTSFMAEALCLLGDYAQALALLEALPDVDHSLLGTLGYVLARAGQSARARDCLAALNTPPRQAVVSHANRALVHLGLGENDLAMTALEAAYAARDIMVPALHTHPLYRPLRAEPRFEALMQKVGVRSAPR